MKKTDEDFAAFNSNCRVCDALTPHYSVRFEKDELGAFQWAECAVCRSSTKVYDTKGLRENSHSQRESQLLDMASVDVRLIESLWHNAKKWSKWPDDGTTIRQMITVILDAEFPLEHTQHHRLDSPA